MNIFYLDNNPQKCAEEHMDRHVVKMILGYNQLLSTAHRICDGEPYPGFTKTGRKRTEYMLPHNDNIIYKATHINHPSAVWARASKNNYEWLYTLLTELNKEYTYRYGRTHKLASDGLIRMLMTPPVNIPDSIFTEPTPAMPDGYKAADDSIISYRKYYKYGKAHLATWSKRPIPEWWGTV
jgi:hypothetical protein